MRMIKMALPVLMLMALGFALAGCPKSDKMMGQAPAPTTHTVQHVG